MPKDRPVPSTYADKKAFFDKLLTIYGRQPVMEALRTPAAQIYRLHLSSSNKPTPDIAEMIRLAKLRGAELVTHTKLELSRISRNSRQDQGVAADIVCQGYGAYDAYLSQRPQSPCRDTWLALDGITNPKNVGMTIRSACAGHLTGLLLPRKGVAELSPLTIKASAGTLFKARVLRCNILGEALRAFKDAGFRVYGLSAHADSSLFDLRPPAGPAVFIVGNENKGLSPDIAQLCDRDLAIPMNNGVESLNVAVTAALIGFHLRP